MGLSMRMGLGLGAGMQKGGGGAKPIDWTIAAAADGTKYVIIQCADEGQTLTVTGGAEIKLESTGTWGTSIDVPAGATNSQIYFRGNGTGGTLTFPKPGNVTYLSLIGTGSYITGSITSLTQLEYLKLDGTLLSIIGIPAQIGTPLSGISITWGTTYDYPWTLQKFGGTKRTWETYTMRINCHAAAPTPEEFDAWLLGLASVSNAGTAELTLKKTPTIAELNAAGYGETDTESGYYAMVTTLGYTLILGS